MLYHYINTRQIPAQENLSNKNRTSHEQHKNDEGPAFRSMTLAVSESAETELEIEGLLSSEYGTHRTVKA